MLRDMTEIREMIKAVTVGIAGRRKTRGAVLDVAVASQLLLSDTDVVNQQVKREAARRGRACFTMGVRGLCT